MVLRSEPAGAAATADRGELPVRVLAKVGEASLKGRNRRFFLDTLRRNLKSALAGLDVRTEDGGSVTAITVADEGVAAAAAVIDERARPMAAHVVEPADRAVVARDHEEVPSADVHCEVVTGRLDLARPRDHQPLTPEERGALPFIDLGIVVPGGGQRAHAAIIPPTRARRAQWWP